MAFGGQQDFLKRLQQLYGDVVMNVVHVYFEREVLDKTTFFLFLDKNKHELFHELIPKISCCECLKSNSIASVSKTGCLDAFQFDLLFDRSACAETNHEIKRGQKIQQYCVCNINPKTVEVADLDIILIRAVIKACCKRTLPGHPSWLKEIKDVRNYIDHIGNSCRISKSDFEEKWIRLETNTLNIALMTGKSFQLMTQKDIHRLKAEHDTIDKIQAVAENANDSLKEDILNALKNQPGVSQDKLGQISYQLNQLLFKITDLEVNISTRRNTDEIVSEQTDPTKCYVRWTLSTPSSWCVEDIKRRLKNVTELTNFTLEFVYAGSIIMDTSVSLDLVKDPEKFCMAFLEFLQNFVKTCEIDTTIVVIVDVAILTSLLPYRVIQIYNMNETDCKYFNSLAGCKKGESCEFRHTKLDPSANKLCAYFKREPNSCLYGDNCIFRHESPEQPIVSATETLQEESFPIRRQCLLTEDDIFVKSGWKTDDNMHTHSTLTNLDEEESATPGNECTINKGFFECEYCSFKIEISYPDEDDSALFVKHFIEIHIDILQGNEIILQCLTDSIRKSSGMEVSNNFEKEFPDLETAANVKGKKVEKKQNPKTSSPNENKEHHRFPEFFSGGRKELLYVIVSSYVSSFLSQKEQILCIMKELALTEQDYCESLETVNKFMMNVGEDLQECATTLQKMFEFHEQLLVKGLKETSDLKLFVSEIFEKGKYILYRKYMSTLSENKKRLLDLRNDNKEFDEKCKEFESNECMLRLPTLLSMPEKRFKYYFSICKRIEKICGQQECGGINRECNEINLLGNAISEYIKDIMMDTDFELKYTEYRWKGRQLRMLRHKYFQEAIRAAVQKKTTSEAIQKAQLGRELGPKIKYANIWAAEQMLLSRCDLLQKYHNLDLHYLFQDEARDSLKILLSAIKNELKSKWSTEAVPFDLEIVTGKGNRSKDKQPILITSVQNTLRREGYDWSIDKDGAYLIYFKI